MAQAARQSLRMHKELKLLLSDPPPGATFPFLTPLAAASSSSSSLTAIDAEIKGPEGTVYAGGIFKIRIQIPDRYPFQPPIVTFSTPIYHPNIDTGGRICLDILNLPPKGAWQPSLNISTVITSIGLLLTEPNPDDGLMCEASREFKYNRQAFDLKARTMTDKYAKASSGMVCSSQATQQTVELRSTGDIEVGHEIKTEDASKPLGMCKKLSLNLSVSHCNKDGNGKENEVTDPVLLSTHESKKNGEPEDSKVKRTNEVHNTGDNNFSKKKKLSLNLLSQPKQNEIVDENRLVDQQVPSHSNPAGIRAVDGSKLHCSEVSICSQQEPDPASKGKVPISYENCKRYTGGKKLSLGYSVMSRNHDKCENENVMLVRKSTNEPLENLKENTPLNSVKAEFSKHTGLRGGSSDTELNKKKCNIEQVLQPVDLSLSDPKSCSMMPHQRVSTEECQSRSATQNKQQPDPSITVIVLDSDESDQEERSRCRRSKLSLLSKRPSQGKIQRK